MSKRKKGPTRPRHTPAAQSGGWAPHEAAVGPPVGAPGYVAGDDLQRWLAEFRQLHQAVPGRIPAQQAGPPRVPAASVPGLPRITEIVQRLDAALGWLSATGALTGQDMQDPGALFDTTRLHRDVCNLFDHLQANILALQAAVGVVARDEPLASTKRNGARWAGKLDPTEVLDLAEAAAVAPESMSYLVGRADQILAEATGLACDGGPRKKVCGGTRVRLADGTRATSCWPHLPADQKAAIRAEREQALQQPCALCHAPSGQPCVDEEGAETTIHNHRLRPTTTRPRSRTSHPG